jgi:hypothetical protein
VPTTEKSSKNELLICYHEMVSDVYSTNQKRLLLKMAAGSQKHTE